MLTKRQAEALEFIRLHTRVMGYAPSYPEIAEALGMSPNSKSAVHYLLHRLRDRGHIRFLPRRWRSIEVVR